MIVVGNQIIFYYIDSLLHSLDKVATWNKL